MILKKNIATSDSGFIFNPSTGDSYSSNPIGSEILQLLKQGNTPQEIKKVILEKYDVENGQFERDWDDFKNQLKEANLIEL
jgi:hypothetical protein